MKFKKIEGISDFRRTGDVVPLQPIAAEIELQKLREEGMDHVFKADADILTL